MDEVFRDASVAFSLGEDFAHYGRPRPEDADQNFEKGYIFRLKQCKPTVQADRFVRKWLQVRRNAWRRNRFFAPEITPDFLRIIDSPFCLISGVALTHGTGEDTDWSVDRVDNDGAYVVRNVSIISTRVNLAKGVLSLNQILALGHNGEDRFGLTGVEWRRMARLGASVGAYPGIPVREVFLSNEGTRHLFRSWSVVFQHQMVASLKYSPSKKNAYWQDLSNGAPVEAFENLVKVRQELELYARGTYVKHRTTAAAFASDKIWTNFSNWWAAAWQSGHVPQLIERWEERFGFDGGSSTQEEIDSEKRIATNGYA